jgi:uncharacterized protein (TIGR03083 family)
MILDDLRDEMASLDAMIRWSDQDDPTVAAQLTLDTPAKGWNIGDTLAHLCWTDLAAVLALTDPEAFAERGRLIPIPLVAELPSVWPQAREALIERLADAQQSGARVPWFSLPMGAVSFATARLMEYWAHGEDVVSALGTHRPGAARLKHVCHIGVSTLGFSFVQHGLPAPTAPVRVELTAPDGSIWEWGNPAATDRVTGPAVDFALVVTQRRVAADAALVAHGPVAEQWLPIAQCFAGKGQLTDTDRTGLPIAR